MGVWRHVAGVILRAALCAAAASHASGWAQGEPPVPPALMLAGTYQAGLTLRDYWVSEKLDGVRGHWTGERLVSRGGLPIAAPTWFTAGWPNIPMDGELWAGRGRFNDTVSTVRQATPDERAWQDVRFMVFDLPTHGGPFDARRQAIESLVQHASSTWLRAVMQQRVSDEKALMSWLRNVEREGGEGLMLHRGAAMYQAGRSNDIVKLKSREDAEAEVVAHLPGQGKYKGMTGALLVRTPEGQTFKLGSGLSDAQRQMPPALGTWVTYRYRGRHPSGLPRFATFVRERSDIALHGAPPR